MTINFNKAILARFDIGKGQLNISPIFNKKAKAYLKLKGQSGLQEVVEFLNHRDLKLISKWIPLNCIIWYN